MAPVTAMTKKKLPPQKKNIHASVPAPVESLITEHCNKKQRSAVKF
jgi:hypothetical protein